MRVLALGGSGGMGRYAVRTAMSLAGVETMVVADLQAKAARDFAASLAGKAEGIGLDVTDGVALRSAMREADVVLNTVGPFFELGPPVLKAAIECGCHYLDICDDWEPTLEMLAMDAAACEADVTAVIGLGASPGLTNMLGLWAMRELDSVESVYTGWDMGSAIPEEETSQAGVNAAMEHAIQQLTGTVRVQRNGAAEMVRPLEHVELTYPGVGERTVLIFGHPEAVTFPHHHPELRTSLNVAHGLDGNERFIRGMRWLVERRWLSASRGARLLGWLERHGTPPAPSDLLQAGRLPPVYGLAVGTREGRAASVGVTFAELGNVGMGYATGVPLACGLELLLGGEITRRGVFAPESGAIDPHAFFLAIAAKDSRPLENAEDGLVISRSWESDAEARYSAAMARARAPEPARSRGASRTASDDVCSGPGARGGEMSILERFGAYAAAFEETYEDDDWTRLEPFFTEDAVYEAGGEARGRDAVFEKLKQSVDGLDRQMDSRTLDADPPKVEGDTLTMVWRASYTKAGKPDLRISGVETAVFQGERIAHLRDEFDPEAQKAMGQWFAEHGPSLQGD